MLLSSNQDLIQTVSAQRVCRPHHFPAGCLDTGRQERVATGVAMALAVLALYRDDGAWWAPAIASFVFLVAGFIVLIAAIVAAVRGRA